MQGRDALWEFADSAYPTDQLSPSGESSGVQVRRRRPATAPIDWAMVWRSYGDLYVRRISELITAASADIEHELLFCILGGHGVSYELARSAAFRLRQLDVFAVDWDPQALQVRVREELNEAQFQPARKNGSLRRYRFPTRKAAHVAAAASWVKKRRPLAELLRGIESEHRRRELMCQCPGVGLKSASWLLRNAGLAENLAVIDVHVLRALASSGRINGVRLPQDYLAIEGKFLDWCSELEAPPAAMDLLLWGWQPAG